MAGGDERIHRRGVGEAALPVLDDLVQGGKGERLARLFQGRRPLPLEGRHPLSGTPVGTQLREQFSPELPGRGRTG